MNVRERFRPQPMAINGTYVVKGVNLGGFLATVSGTLTITDNTTSTVLVNAVPVTAGVFTPLPFVFEASAGATVVLAGGAAGTLAV
jgi:hypothetical protein